MRRLLMIILAVACTGSAALAEPQQGSGTKTHSAEFEKLKTLVGRWDGTSAHDGKTEDVSVTYHLTSGNTAIVETLSPGTAHEMVSVYHDENGKLVMTHYCMLGNQPKLDVKRNAGSEIELGFAADNSIDPKSDHMNGVRFTFIDADNIVQHWSGIHSGKPTPPVIFKLARAK